MNSAKEKLIIENLCSNADVFSRCVGIIHSKYFSPELRPCVSFVKEYFEKYNSIPTQAIIKAETNTDLLKRDITRDVFKYTCDEVENFCKVSATKLAIKEALPTLDDGDDGSLLENLKRAMAISLEKDLGISLFGNVEEKLKKMAESEIYFSTGIHSIDEILDGGLARATLSLISANSGVGKSVMLANFAKYYSEMGMDVLYLSLELKESMIYLRLASMVSKVSIQMWKQEISAIAHEIDRLEENEAGSLIIKRLQSGISSNGLRSFLKLYELEHKKVPDVLIVDYLDVMQPNEGIKDLSISDQDKLKSEQLLEILEEYDMIGLTASQQNREALRSGSNSQAIIAGGLSKVNAVHNYMALEMTTEMRLNGMMMMYFLKTRTSSGVGKTLQLSFNPSNLIITNSDKAGPPPTVLPNQNSGAGSGKAKYAKNKGKSTADEIIASMKKNINNLPEHIKAEFAEVNAGATMVIEDADGSKKEIDLLNLLDTI